MTQRVERFLLIIIIFFISSQVGFHFWPSFSYINGIRIDYLSPTLYLLDVLIIFWCGITLVREGAGDLRFGKTISALILLFILDLLANIFFANSTGAHVFGLVKLGELGLFGWLVAKRFDKKYIPWFVRILSISAIVSSILAIWQFFSGGSVGGLWYFFGERTFNSSTIGISTVNLGQQILRAYGAFPHPNVLAFFLLMNIVFSALRMRYEQDLWFKILMAISILLSSVALILTFSRITIFLALCFLLYLIYASLKDKLRYFTLGFLQAVIPTMLVFSLATYSSFLFRGIDFRQELLSQSLTIFLKNPYFGIGLNNFFINQVPLIKTISPINFQPVHNIFVLALLELGLFGFWIMPVGFLVGLVGLVGKVKGSKGEVKDFYRSVLFVLISIIVVGMFDHFFLTLEQGEVMLALILGLSFVIFLPDGLSKRKSKR